MPQNRRSYEKTRRIALSGLLFALAMALSFIEGTLTIPGLLPGMKLGLANIVVMYALFFMGPRQALVLDVLKALFVFLVSGFTAGFLSLCGGLLSLLVMWVLYYLLPVRPTWFILSVCGALAHNIGQLLGAGVIISSSLSFYYAPVMLVLDVLKALFVFLVSGFTAGFLSLCGGLLSLLVMWVLYYLLPVRPTWFILSVCGALAHNIGQLLGAGVIISSSLSFYYAPVMLVLGLVMGALTSITLKALLPALGKMGFSTQEKRGE